MIEVKQSAKPLGFANARFAAAGSRIGEGDDIVQSLMVSFVMIVGEVFAEDVAQGTLAEENHLMEAFLFHRADPAFSESIEIG